MLWDRGTAFSSYTQMYRIYGVGDSSVSYGEFDEYTYVCHITLSVGAAIP